MVAIVNKPIHAHFDPVIKVGITLFVGLSLSMSFFGCSANGASENEGQEGAAFVSSGVRQVSPEDAFGMIASSETKLLDVRTQEEYDDSHIPNAILLPLDQINEDSLSQALPDKDELVIVYCASGIRSAQAALQLVQLGYRNVVDMGGINSWPYETIDAVQSNMSSIETDFLPVNVKVICGKTNWPLLPNDDE